jgi:hypothetical protein
LPPAARVGLDHPGADYAANQVGMLDELEDIDRKFFGFIIKCDAASPVAILENRFRHNANPMRMECRFSKALINSMRI